MSGFTIDVGAALDGLDEERLMDAAAKLARDVERKAYDIRVLQAARDKIAAENAGDVPPFDAGTLAQVLARPAEPAHRVDGLIPWEASSLLVAQRKTGKTTLVVNLAHSLITGEPFLGRFDVRPIEGNVAVLNFEVSAAQLATWADERGLPGHRLLLVNLRGRRNPLRDDDDRTRLAELLKGHDVETVVVDPFGRAYNGKSQNDAAEVGGWLVRLDQFARADVGARDLVLTAHSGWEAERSRGSSALEDWPDVVITMTRDKQDPTQRYLAAEGRDVLVEEDRLDLAPGRRLVLAGAGSRAKARAVARDSELATLVVQLVTETPGINTRELEDAVRNAGVGFQRGEVGKAGRAATASGHLRQQHGPKNSVLWFPQGQYSRVLPSTPGGSTGVLPTRPIEDGSTP